MFGSTEHLQCSTRRTGPAPAYSGFTTQGFVYFSFLRTGQERFELSRASFGGSPTQPTLCPSPRRTTRWRRVALSGMGQAGFEPAASGFATRRSFH